MFGCIWCATDEIFSIVEIYAELIIFLELEITKYGHMSYFQSDYWT